MTTGYQASALGNVPTKGIDPGLAAFLTRVKEVLEVRNRQRGNALDSSPTYRDLLDAGVIQVKDGKALISGKTYSMSELLGMVTSTLPGWITSDIAPPAPTGLLVTSDKANTVLTWDQCLFDQYSHTEIWRATSNNLSAAEMVDSVTGKTWTSYLPANGTSYFYWIRHVAFNPLLVSPFNNVNGTSDNSGPGAVTVASAFGGEFVNLSWPTPTSNLTIIGYRIEWFDGAVWQELDVVAGNTYKMRVTWGGARQFRISAQDFRGAYGPTSTFTVTVVVPGSPVGSYAFDGEHVALKWGPPLTGSLPILRYEVYDTTVSTDTLLSSAFSTTYRTKVTWASKTYVVRAVDTAGNIGDLYTVTISIATANITSFTSEVVDNNVKLSWTATQGSLPIMTYEIRRGANWASPDKNIGRKDGGFTVVFEAPQQTVYYTYWISPVDTAGNYGTPVSLTAAVTQPPDYILGADWIDDFSQTHQEDADAFLLFSGNAVMQTSGTLTGNARCHALKPASKVYFEYVYDVFSNGMQVGVMLATGIHGALLSSQTAGVSYYYRPSGLIGTNGTEQAVTSLPSGYDCGVVGVAVDQVANTITFYVNGVQVGTPITLPAGVWYPAVSFGPVAGQQGTLNFGAKPFRYAIPAGFSGLVQSVLNEGSYLLLPVNTVQTFDQHFTSRSWATPQDQINAGYPIYAQPGATTAIYEATRDYGTTLAAMKITVVYNLELLAGSVSLAIEIKVAQDPQFTTGVQTFSGSQAFAVNFRYVRIKITATATNDIGVAKLSDVHYVLDAKLRSDGGVATLTLGGANAQGNVGADYVDSWVPGMTMPPSGWSLFGTSAESKIVSGVGPSGVNEPLWACVDADAAADADGGWYGSGLKTIDTSIGHLFAVFVKQTTGATNANWGPLPNSTLLDLAGSVVADPFFVGAALPAMNTWYLVVGYLHPIGYGTTDTGISGVYNLSGTKVASGTEFKMPGGLTQIDHKCPAFGMTGNTGLEKQWMTRPVVMPCTEANASSVISYLLKCATGYGASVKPTQTFVDVTKITVAGKGPSAVLPVFDFVDIPNPKRFNIFNYAIPAGTPTGGDTGWDIEGY